MAFKYQHFNVLSTAAVTKTAGPSTKTLTSSRGPSSPHPIKFGLNYTEALQLTSNIMYGPWSMPPEGFNTFVVLL